MKTLVPLFQLLVVGIITDFRASGACSSIVANTDWAICLPGNSCPHSSLQLDDDLECGEGNTCCLMRPTFDLNVIDAPCIIEGVSEQGDIAKKRYKSHH